jgi:hypothetical protein
MLIIEKIIRKRILNFPIFRIKNNRIQFLFDDQKHFISIEKIDEDCFLCYIDKFFLEEITYLIGMDKYIITNVIMDWFLRELKIVKIKDLELKFNFTK